MYWILPALGITAVLAVICAVVPVLPEAVILWGRYECLALVVFYVIGSIVNLARAPSLQALHPYVVVVAALQIPQGLTIATMLLVLPLMYTILHYVQIV